MSVYKINNTGTDLKEKNMNRNVNIALQVLPSSKKVHPYSIVDKAIEIIKESGIKYRVCPFETVMEGEFSQLMKIVEKVHEACYEAGAEDMMAYIKIESHSDRSAQIEDKMKKYE